MAAVTFLGTGAGDVSLERFQSSILLQGSDLNVLLDAGEPCAGRLLELGFALGDLSAVLISHAHPDHVGGLPLLLQASGLRGRTTELPLGVPGDLQEPLETWLSALQLSPEKRRFPLRYFSWRAGKAEKLGDMSITPHRSSHFKRASAQSSGPEAFLFDLTLDGKRLLYSGDLGGASDLQPHIEQPLDVLICELAHLTAEALVEVLASAKIGCLCLTHLPADLDDQRGTIREFCEEKLPATESVYLPDDGERIEF